jgi:hypothetical protein
MPIGISNTNWYLKYQLVPVGMSFTEMIAADDWKPFQSCYFVVLVVVVLVVRIEVSQFKAFK